jgi:hypothetical protein
MEIQDIIQGLTSAEIASITSPEARTLIVNTTLQQAVIYVDGTFKQASFENTDDIPEGTKKFATTSDLDQINTNANAITSLQNSKEDSFSKNSAFNKSFGTSAGDVLEGDTRTITPSEISAIANQSGVNTGDETTATIQSKRPLKTIKGNSLEGNGNIDLDKSDVGLGNVDNTSDADKPISSDTQTALDGKKDDFVENNAFNKNFGTNTNTVLEGNTRIITPSEIAVIGNQSGTNTGDETTTTIQAKRPIKTVNGNTLEGNGNIQITSVSPINSASFISSLSQNVGTSSNGIGTNIQINLTNILGPNTFGYNLSSGSVIIPTAGWYKIGYKCLTELFTNNRQNTSFVVKRNLIDVLGTLSAGYSRNNSNDFATSSLSPIIPQFQFSAGDTIGLYAITGGDNQQLAFTNAQECVLTIEFLG